jgi:hypothetical protein
MMYDPHLLGLQVAKTSGKELIVFCPYHSDQNASAEYNPEKGFFYCFGCQTAKSARELAEDLGGALVPISDTHQIFGKFDEAKSSDWRHLLHNPSAVGNKYLQNRGVPDFLVRYFKLRQNPDGILFPLEDRFGDVIGFQVRHYEAKPKYMFYGERPPVWPMRQLFVNAPTFITEGVFGVLRGLSFRANTVAIMGAGAMGSYGKLMTTLPASDKVYAMMDGDFAGMVAAGKSVLLGIPAIMRPPGWPEPDEMSESEWLSILHDPEHYATWDVMDIIDESDQPEKLTKILKRFWRRLEGVRK